MEFEPEDQDIVDLLTKLKNRDRTYPRKLYAARRQDFLSQMAGVGLGLGVGVGIKTGARTPRGSSLLRLPSMSASSILEAVLLLAIIIQAGIIVYSYHDKITDFVNSFSISSTPETSQLPVTVSNPIDVVISDTPIATTTVTASVTPSPSNTATNVPSSTSVDEVGSSTTSNTSPGVTPQPTNDNNNDDNNGNNGNNGNHYGQTPGPPQPKEEPKPTKNKSDGKKQ